MWNFGSWKTLSEQKKMFKTDPNDVFVISNVPYTRVDHFFSSEEDLINVFSVLDEWCQETNYHVEDYSKSRENLKDIYIIIDEAHRYFDSRSSLLKWNNLEKMNNVLTQCRKRNIRIVAITQRLTMIDIRFRRLSDYVEEYKRGSFLGIYRVKHSVYENRWDLADIETDNVVRVNSDWDAKSLKDDSLIYWEFFKPLTFGLQLFAVFDKSFRKITKEYYNTYYICALHDENVKPLTLEDLQKWLLKNDYQNVKEYVNKESLFTKALNKFNNIINKILIKIKDICFSGVKRRRFQVGQSNIQDFNKITKIDNSFKMWSLQDVNLNNNWNIKSNS